MTTSSSIGLFSTLTSSGSRALVTTMARACRTGSIPGATVAFVFCNREAGESPVTDESVAHLEGDGLTVVRCSAARFDPEARRSARQLEAAGDDRALWDWRDDWYRRFRDRLPATDLDFLHGDMWIWGRRQCAERRGVNLHPALPSGPLGKMWFDVIWDLVAARAEVSGVMLHRVTPEVDRGPVVTYCTYGLHTPDLDELWAALPACVHDRIALVATQRALKRQATHPLFHALRARGLDRELPLMLETARAVAQGRLRLTGDSVRGADGRELLGGLDLTDEVERQAGSDRHGEGS